MSDSDPDILSDDERFNKIKAIVVQRLAKKAFTEEQVSEAISESIKKSNAFFVALGLVTQDKYCNRCGRCCRLSDPIKILPIDIPSMCNELHMSAGLFHERYLDPLDDEDCYRFRQVPCPFLRPGFCMVYKSRPTVCRAYPFMGILSIMLEKGQPQIQGFECAVILNHFADAAIFTLLHAEPFQTSNPILIRANELALQI